MTDFSKYGVLLKSALSIVAFLFGAFNGFLLDLAPPGPDNELNIPIGIAKFTTLALLLFVSLLCNFKALNKKETQRKFISLWLWIAGGLIMVFLASSLLYYNNYSEKTVWHQNWKTRMVKGDGLTEESKEICREENQSRSDKSCEQFLLYKYYNADEVIQKFLLWSEESVRANRKSLVYQYILLVVSISSLLFSLVELLSWNLFQKKAAVAPNTKAKSLAG